MDHGGMDHGGHGGMDHGAMCSMNMIWNTQIIDTCIVFDWWHIRSNAGFAFSFFIIVILGIAYEYLRELQRAVDRRIALTIKVSRGSSNGRSRSEERDASVSSEEAAYQEEGLLTGRRVRKAGALNG